DDPTHLDGVRVLGVDEHCWSHVRGRGKETYATILVDLTPVIEGTGSSRLLDVRPGRSKKVLATWLKERTPAFRDGIEVVTMDGFAGYHSATVAELPEAISVMDLDCPGFNRGIEIGNGDSHSCLLSTVMKLR